MTAQATPPSGPAPPAPSAPPAAQVPRRAPRRPPPRRSRVLAVLAYAGIAILFLIVTATTFLLVAPPVDIVRERLIAEFQARTGYLLEINGATSLRLQPAPSIEFRDVVVATAGENGSPVLRAEAIEVEPRLAGLFWGRVQAERIVVRRPQLDLVIDAEGRRKWLRAEHDEGAPRRVRVAQLRADDTAGRFSMPALREGSAPVKIRDETGPASKATREFKSQTKTEAAPSRAIQMPDIRISDGIVRYRDLRTGTLVQSDQIQVRVAQRSGKTLPLHARGSFAYGGETVKLEFGADLPENRRARALERIVLRLENRHGHARYDGAVSFADRPVFAGAIDVETPSARDAVRWFGRAFRGREGGLAGPVALKGRIDSQDGRTTVEQMDLTIEGARVGGQLTVDHAGARPRFTADLDFAELDFDRMREKLEQRQSERGAARRSALKEGGDDAGRPERARPQPSPSAPAETDDDNDPADRAPGGRAPHTWRTDPIAFVTLAGADGEARLKASRVVWRGAILTDAIGALYLADGAMKIDIRRGTLHGGNATGVITASTAGHIGIDLALDDVSALETLNNSGRFEMLDGRARIKLAVAGHGATEKEIVDTLAGSASIDIDNGAIVGWSIHDILASARRLELPNLERNASARTPFTRLTATLAINDGVATGQGMQIASSPISLDSSGTIDLRARTMDLTLNPRIADNGGAGGSNRFAGLSVPLHLTGPWHRPRLRADYQKILKSPAKVFGAARDAARDIKDEDIDKAAKRLLGDGPEAEKGAKKAKDLLRKFLDR
ncbi:MAG: AsmA family protein [Hyphomicrobiaceae bacterium]